MPERSADWMRQADLDLSQATDSLRLAQAKVLDKHYTLSRYPNGFDSGAPGDQYTKGEAETAVRTAGEIIAFCKDHLRQ